MSPVPDLRAAIQSARRLHQSGAGSVLDALLRSTSLSPAELADQLSRHAGVAALMNGEGAVPDWAVLDLAGARALGCVAVRLPGEAALRLAMADPWNDELVRKASRVLGAVPHLVAVPSALLDQWLGAPTAGLTGGSPASGGDTSPAGQATGPVVEFVDGAIRAAFSSGASDIHFECSRSGVEVKLRQDGVMSRFARMADMRRAEEVISRIKVLAQLDITERRTPQDGRFRFDVGSGSIDLRVSIMPSVHGEDAVLRLLDKAQLRSREDAVSLDLLGFSADNAQRIRELAELPHGMLLVTGPTGSGKTTTVYAVLSEINTGLEKIITIEDPVEYELPGVLQIPVNERKGLTFAKGLRSILRHDPDRILVGEIRDAETAEIAVQSALTGHQVFTTVHANSVFDVTGRFRHFGLDMFGFMSSLNGVIVQRLVRRLCPHCAGVRDASERERRWLDSLGRNAARVPSATGCSACHGTGYHGRLVIAEVHAVDDRLRDMVTGNSPVSALREHVAASGARSLSEQAVDMVTAGVTTAEEIKRVVGWQ
ncbi:GspE/PulE family protein [Ideonella sp. BN130291]|uniref:GspE/PulE family protein n=1 Tax=Ideonella sp. BN130291 TaxID=3112940 RepID=UPI002E26CCE1|nr:GspE/PulE family protein [Ideonella sp. BN130291]